MKIAVVGAGIAGLSCAEVLQAQGHVVEVFDKGRGAGGRMATRRVASAAGEIAFDHGAQYFTARDPAFAAMVERWRSEDVVAHWPSAGDDAWVGTPGMNAVVKAMAQRFDVHWNSRVETIRRVGAGWALDPLSDATFDAVVVAIPAEQAAVLLEAPDATMATAARACSSAPCWTAMVAFHQRVAIAADIVKQSGIIGWAARNSAKPGRGGPEAWVIQGSPQWSRDHLEDAQSDVVDALLAALAAEAIDPLPEPILRIGHRWRYARVAAGDAGALWNDAARIGAVGDWLLAPRVESAWLSGRKLAERIGAAHA
ncbi:FAD-dependent oxidoreductase [Sphingomonas sp. TREG-RG-20F-R18-01]|uniref:NAD(P)/FAD-dependent oxidoreductase n=1 Tax=Sphingomonas sp. TREG-RG-20F-R18-01 TaxID=2914982 RepID=UPI001F56ED03|nr:FAD-dependent oxidoreductase [Sphingomonas sp. TREG-RG-20F-R18-01]